MLRSQVPVLQAGFFLAVVFAVLLLAPANQAHAQTLRIGPKAGLNLGWYGGSDWNDEVDAINNDPDFSATNDVKAGFFGGGFLEIGFSPSFAVQIELLIGTVGGGVTIKERGFPERFEGWDRLTVLSFPLLLKPKLPVGDSGAIYGLIGPEPAIILGDIQTKLRVTGLGTDTFYEPPDNRFVFSGTIGAGYEHRFNTGALNAEVRYNRTFTDIFDDFITRINSINFFFGYGFNL